MTADSTATLLLALAGVFVATPRLTASDGPFPDPVEYLTDGTSFHTRDEYVRRFCTGDGLLEKQRLARLEQDKVEVRGEGERSDRWITNVGLPSLTLFRPHGEPTAAVLICPGGGYAGLSFDKEGVFVAKWLRERGVAGAVMKYRVAGEEPLVRNGASPGREVGYAVRVLKETLGCEVGLMGFSAGGHLAAMAACDPIAEEIADGTTNLMAHSGEVDFLALVYPVISMQPDAGHPGSRRRLLGDSPKPEQVSWYSAEQRVGNKTPPTFLVHAADDRAVPVANSMRFYEACLEHSVSAEMHLYERGGHGFGMWRDTGTIANWPAAYEAWLKANGWMR